jgi:hypothetical protein
MQYLVKIICLSKFSHGTHSSKSLPMDPVAETEMSEFPDILYILTRVGSEI